MKSALIPYLDERPLFLPHPLSKRYDGLLFYAPMVDADFLYECYRYGIFPWHNSGINGAFYFPEERFIIEPGKIKIARSVRPLLNQQRFTISFDTCFREVMLQCKRGGLRKETSSWITSPYLYVYPELHKKGLAHSVEVWHNDQLVGGLYGVSIGKIFTGESMFSLVPNASRYAMIHLARHLDLLGYKVIDCQVFNPYLASFGGQSLKDVNYFELIRENLWIDESASSWK